jgi:hypothetical protein
LQQIQQLAAQRFRSANCFAAKVDVAKKILSTFGDGGNFNRSTSGQTLFITP